MTLIVGTLIEHTTWGLGKVVAVTPPHFTAHFTSLEPSAQGPRRKLQLITSFVSIAAVQSDPLLDAIGTGAAKGGAGKKRNTKATPKPTMHSLDQAIEWFVREYPGRFADPNLVSRELGYKRKAQGLFQTYFGHERGEALLKTADVATIAQGLTKLYSATNIPSRFEIMAVQDGLSDRNAAGLLLRALLDFVAHQDADTFERLASAVAGLPAPAEGTAVLTWPNVTILPFLANPTHCMVLKPAITRRMARRVGMDLMYSTPPKWHSYSLLMDMSKMLLDRLAPLGAKDFIDVQSFIWVTQNLEKADAPDGKRTAPLPDGPLAANSNSAASGAVFPEVVVAVGAEGGSLTLEGLRLADGEWLFRTGREETTMFGLLDDEDSPEEQRLQEHSPWTRSLPEALCGLDRYPWPKLYPLAVHADFAGTILDAVEKHPQGGLDERKRWSKRLSELSARTDGLTRE